MACQILFYSTLLFSSPSQDVLQDSQWLSFCQPPNHLIDSHIFAEAEEAGVPIPSVPLPRRPFHFFKTPVLDGTNKLGRCIHRQCPWKTCLVNFLPVLCCAKPVCGVSLSAFESSNVHWRRIRKNLFALWCGVLKSDYILNSLTRLSSCILTGFSVPAGTYGVGRKESLRSEWPLS